MMLSPINYKSSSPIQIAGSEPSMGSPISLWSIYKQYFFFSIQPKEYKLSCNKYWIGDLSRLNKVLLIYLEEMED